jgi:hypothetical protein
MGSDGFDRDERMSPGQRAFWTVVSAFSAVLLYLTVLCSLPRGAVGY